MSILPKISVVIPCFNAERYIEIAVRSALSQDWPDLEVVVVDDGSTDSSVALIKRSFPGVTLLRQSNAGVAAARNTGIAHAQAHWITFLDADDVWLPGKLQAHWAIHRDSPGVRMSYTAWEDWCSEAPSPTCAYLSTLLNDATDGVRWSGISGWIYPQLLAGCLVWTGTVMVHRSVFEEVGVFNESLRIGEDYDLWLRASRVTEIIRIPVPYALYRWHRASLTQSVPEKNYYSLVLTSALQRWGYTASNGLIADRHKVAIALSKSWSDFASAHLAIGNLATARGASTTALRTNWRNMAGWKVLIKTGFKFFSEKCRTRSLSTNEVRRSDKVM
jgi:glycosyltransferase involved in cell wall biosynthesis